ncbi:hypothetical protein KY342_04440 [Candidatus Woesearchaeota archaeon]|nr:hypothetical protein [Candidatus Woesearchaeota archaeon]
MKDNKKTGTLLVLAGLLIGIGIGLVIDQIAAGTLIGLGVGFLAAFIYAMIKK